MLYMYLSTSVYGNHGYGQIPKNLTSSTGIWSSQRFGEAMLAGIDMAGLGQNVSQDPREEVAEKVHQKISRV